MTPLVHLAVRTSFPRLTPTARARVASFRAGTADADVERASRAAAMTGQGEAVALMLLGSLRLEISLSQDAVDLLEGKPGCRLRSVEVTGHDRNIREALSALCKSDREVRDAVPLSLYQPDKALLFADRGRHGARHSSVPPFLPRRDHEITRRTTAVHSVSAA